MVTKFIIKADSNTKLTPKKQNNNIRGISFKCYMKIKMLHRWIDAHVKYKTQISLDPCYPFGYYRKEITLLPRHITPSPTKPALHVQVLSPGDVFVQFAFVEHPPLSVAHGLNSVEVMGKAFTIRPGISIKKVN